MLMFKLHDWLNFKFLKQMEFFKYFIFLIIHQETKKLKLNINFCNY